MRTFKFLLKTVFDTALRLFIGVIVAFLFISILAALVTTFSN